MGNEWVALGRWANFKGLEPKPRNREPLVIASSNFSITPATHREPLALLKPHMKL